MKISIDLTGPDILKLISEWPERVMHLRELVPFLAAETTKKEVIEALPSEMGARSLKSSLRLARVMGVGAGVPAFSVFSDATDESVSELDPVATILYVKAKQLPVLIPKEIQILEDFGPWTVATIPFMPDKRDALVISRRVPPAVVQRIEKERGEDRGFWEPKLQRAGIRNIQKIRVAAKPMALPDVAFLSMKYEFGLGGVMVKPHWRPSILGFVHNLKTVANKPKFRGVLMNVADQSWRKKFTVDKSIPASEAGKFVAFQNTLGIKVAK